MVTKKACVYVVCVDGCLRARRPEVDAGKLFGLLSTVRREEGLLI